VMALEIAANDVTLDDISPQLLSITVTVLVVSLVLGALIWFLRARNRELEDALYAAWLGAATRARDAGVKVSPEDTVGEINARVEEAQNRRLGRKFKGH
jgi:hypothetical protein